MHAGTAVESGRREALEWLCRYILCPAIDEDRLAWTRDGKVVYRFERPWKDGTKLVVFEPLVLIERLAALVPRPRRNLATYHEAFAPGPSYRERIVPPPPAEDESPPAFRSVQRRLSTPRKKRADDERSRRRHSRAQLMLRCFGIDVLVCPRCQTRRQLLTWPQTVLLQPPAEAGRLRMQRPASRVHHRPAHDRPDPDLARSARGTPTARTSEATARRTRTAGRLNVATLDTATGIEAGGCPGSAPHRLDRLEVGKTSATCLPLDCLLSRSPSLQTHQPSHPARLAGNLFVLTTFCRSTGGKPIKAVTVRFAFMALGASSALHLWLFRPFDHPTRETIVPILRPDEPPEDEDDGILVAPDAAGEPLEDRLPATDAPEEADGARLGGQPRDDLAIDLDAGDEIAMITLADAMRLQLVLVARQPRSVWQVHIDAAGRLAVGERVESAPSMFL
ncbi:MAG: transposase [Planctomycetes bacterium]|nr:transposase [Planctomycetota bacterium]